MLNIKNYYIEKMTFENASLISKWTYEEPYSLYNMEESQDTMDELLNGDYYSVRNDNKELIGYYCFGTSAQVPSGNDIGAYKNNDAIDIGLGLKPNITGKGLGLKFFETGLEFARRHYHNESIRLTVAAFNERAIKVYERAGFKVINQFINPKCNRLFYVMTKEKKVENVRTVEVVPHQKNWKKIYQKEKELIQKIFGDEIISIHHIGSTSIPNMSAKPIIDILVSVNDINRVDQYNERIRESNYNPMGEYGIPLRRFFYKEVDGKRTFHIHIFDQSSPDITRHLNFRDYLIEHQEDAKRYSLLKEELANKYPKDIDSYIKGKDALIKELDEKAREWRSKLIE